jgi:hypothetical protein
MTDEAKKNFGSVRLVIEGLMLAAILWSARTQVEMVADVPSLTQRVATNEARIEALKEQVKSMQESKR